MKNFIAPLLLLSILLISTGCPVGVAYPLAQPGTDKIDARLLGTWATDKEDHDIQLVKIERYDDYSYAIEVLETGSMYALEDFKFRGWVTKISGKDFVFAMPSSAEEYYTYCYVIDDENQMRSYDVGLLVGGVDAVTSIEAYRKEVEASLKMEDCLSEETVWYKE